MEKIYIATFIILFIGLVVLFSLGVLLQVLMVRNRKSEIKLFDKKILFNPFNLQLFGNKYLKEKGIYYRNKSWVCIALFIFIILIVMGLYAFL